MSGAMSIEEFALTWSLPVKKKHLNFSSQNMELKVRFFLFMFFLFIGGCQSISTAMQYNSKVNLVQMSDDKYRIFEHPKGDRIMTTSSLGKAVGQGVVQGATLGLASVKTPEQRHEAAARHYLDQTGRSSCQITKGYLLVEPQYEFFFVCNKQSG
mgnify:CR=1 FL=1